MGYSKKYKNAIAVQDKNLAVAEPAVKYQAEKKKTSYVSHGVTFIIDPELKPSDIEPEKVIKARKMFEKYRESS